MTRMKYSNIEWVGQIPSDWDVKRNKYNFTLNKNIVGETYSQRQLLSLSKHGVKPIGEEDQRGKVPLSYATYQSVDKDDIIMCLFDLDVSAVFSGRSQYNGMISPAYKCLKCNEHVYPQYADYYFRTVFVDRKYKRYSRNVRYSISTDEFMALPIIVPPFLQQICIANFLDEKCEKIDSLTADIQSQIDTLEEYKKSVITEAVTKGLNPDVEMKDSGVAWCPQIPRHWIHTNPKALFKLREDRALPNERQLTASQEFGIIYQDEYMEKTGNRVVTVQKDFSILKHVEPDDFVISMRSFQGGLEYSERRGCISSAYVMLIPNKELVYAPFFRWFFKSSKYINAIQSTSNLVRDGQAMRYANFVQVPLFIIPMDEQKVIAEYLDEKVANINYVIGAKKEQLETLAEYKKSLIYEYVTGKKEVAAA